MSVLVVGGGPAGLMAAERLAKAGHAVTVFDHMPSVGRRLLMAGRGGLNLTHSETLPALLARYGEARLICQAVAAFPPGALVAWCERLGQATFVGSSGRVFPVAMKASPLLRAWLVRLRDLGVRLVTGRRWQGLHDRDGAQAVVLACGGAAWPRLGADGGWAGQLAGCHIAPFQPANAGIVVGWSAPMRRFGGMPLKRIALRVGETTVRGEAIVTENGLEGGAVYALIPAIRSALTAGEAVLRIDLWPDLDEAQLRARLDRPRGSQSLSTFLRKAGLPPVAIALLQEALHTKGAAAHADLPSLVRALPVRVSGIAGLARAISSAGGLMLDELDEHFMLRRHPGVFAAGEMLDWEAPTGGYLLQACFSTGHAAGEGAAAWLAARRA